MIRCTLCGLPVRWALAYHETYGWKTAGTPQGRFTCYIDAEGVRRRHIVDVAMPTDPVELERWLQS